VGEPVGQFYGYKVIGMFKEESDFYKKDADGNFQLDEAGNRIRIAIPKGQQISKNGIWVGDYIYEDLHEDGVIDEKDRTFLGNPAPKFTFGFNNYFAYKGFDLNIFLNGSVGNKAVNLIRRTFTDPMRNSNLLKEATDIALIGMHDPEVGDEELSNVYIVNAEACFDSFFDLAKLRNQLFTAITRSKAWVRVLGVGSGMDGLIAEYKKVKDHNFTLDFIYPTKAQRDHMNIVNRDMSEAEKRKIQKSKGNAENLIQELESGNIYLEDLGKDTVDRLISLLKSKEG
jgi:hypothetical protein